jgi:PAS domain S-box-containing protein
MSDGTRAVQEEAGSAPTAPPRLIPSALERQVAQDTKEWLANVIEFLPDATFVIDRDKRIVAWNHACEVMTGVKKEALLGQSDYAYAEPFFGERRPILIDLLDMTSPEVEAFYKYVQRKGDVVYAESFIPRLRNGQGAYLWGEAAPLFDQAGQRCGAIEVIRDITEQKGVEQALRESERKYRELVEHANSIILHWTRDGRVIFLNEFGQRFFGYSEPEIRGRHVIGTIVPETESSGRDLRPLMDEICKNPTAFEQNVNENMRRNGEHVWIAWTNKVVLDQQGQVTEILSIGLDITERKRAEEALHQLNLELEQRVGQRTAELNATNEQLRAKNGELKGFAYTVSHDLKAPLRGIAGYASELDRKHRAGLSDRAHFCLTQILTATSHLDHLIEDLLRYSRLEAETPSPTEVNLPNLVETILRDRQLEIAEHHIEVAVDIPFSTLWTWERGLAQVLTNLIDNAIKYSRQSSPPRLRITAAAIDRAWRLSVCDNGIGFDMKYHDRIFGLFNRLVRMEEFEGTGAGLAIVKKVLDKLGGKIWAESSPGAGATFFVDIPKPSASA